MEKEDEEEIEYQKEDAQRKQVTNRDKRQQVIINLRGNVARRVTDKGWFDWVPHKPYMTVDEFVNKIILEGERDFTNVVLKGKKPNLNEHEAFEELDEYFRVKQEYSPTDNYLILCGANFKGLVATDLFLPKLYAKGADLKNVNFHSSIINGAIFDENTQLKGMSFVHVVGYDIISKGTHWAKVDVSNAKLDPLELCGSDLRGIVGLDKLSVGCNIYFSNCLVSEKEAKIIDKIQEEQKRYTLLK
jgi:hypothetical protein